MIYRTQNSVYVTGVSVEDGGYVRKDGKILRNIYWEIVRVIEDQTYRLVVSNEDGLLIRTSPLAQTPSHGGIRIVETLAEVTP